MRAASRPGVYFRSDRRVDVTADATEVLLQLDAGSDAEPREVAELSFRLRDELREVDGVILRRETAVPPAGAKAGAAVEWGTLLVGVVSSGALTALLTQANAWLGRQRHGTIRVKVGDDELELTGATSEDQRRVVDEWLARRAATRSDG